MVSTKDIIPRDPVTGEVDFDPDACESCGISFVGIGICHQTKPVDRWLCCGCAERDQRATHPKNWQGEYLPVP